MSLYKLFLSHPSLITQSISVDANTSKFTTMTPKQKGLNTRKPAAMLLSRFMLVSRRETCEHSSVEQKNQEPHL